MSNSISAKSRRGRVPRNALPTQEERARHFDFPFDVAATAASSAPERQAAFLAFLRCLVCGEQERRPDARLGCFNAALAALAARGLTAADVLRETKEPAA